MSLPTIPGIEVYELGDGVRIRFLTSGPHGLTESFHECKFGDVNTVKKLIALLELACHNIMCRYPGSTPIKSLQCSPGHTFLSEDKTFKTEPPSPIANRTLSAFEVLTSVMGYTFDETVEIMTKARIRQLEEFKDKLERDHLERYQEDMRRKSDG